MRKPRSNPNTCPRCGYVVEKPEKTWHIVSPIPDARGRVTITVMGSFKCPRCGYSWRAVISKIKAGEDVELESSEETKEEARARESREGKIIEIDLSDLDED